MGRTAFLLIKFTTDGAEFREVFSRLTKDTQHGLLVIAKELLSMQKKLLHGPANAGLAPDVGIGEDGSRVHIRREE